MKRLKTQLNFYINSNLHVALAGYSLTRLTEIYYNLPQSFVPLFVALAIVVSYNFIRFYEVLHKQANWFQEWFLKNQYKVLFLSLGAFAGLLYLAFSKKIQLNTLLVTLPFAFMTFFYVVPIRRLGNIVISFRNFPGIKILSIAIAWAGVTVFLPFINSEIKIDSFVWYIFLQQLVFLIVYTIPFDIRDVELDSTDLKTLPQILGVLPTKILSTILVFGWLFLSYKLTHTFNFTFLIIGFLLVLLTWFTTPNKNRFYTSFWVEAIPIYWLILELFI